MEALKLIKKIDSSYLEELNRFKGETVEIIILHYDNRDSRKDLRQQAFKIIDKYSQNISKWTREELYDR